MQGYFKISLFWLWGILNPLNAQQTNFHSILIRESKIKNHTLIYSYYTLQNNINNANSSVFLDSNPTPEQAMIAAINLPSDFVAIRDSQTVIAIILLVNKPKREFIIIDPIRQSQYVLPCNLIGDITSNRANELVKHDFESKSYIQKGELIIQGRKLKIISNKALEKKIMDIISSEGLLTQNKIVLSDAERKKTMILQQSLENRSLDYFTKIKGNENVEIEIVPGVYETNLNFALYKWGRATKDLGIETVDFSLIIWQELVHRNPTKQEIEMIQSGFNKSWEK
jgi:hypothetical protein